MGLTVAFVLGAGSGVRLQRGSNKMYLELDGVAMIARAAKPFVQHPDIDETYVVAAPAEIERCSGVLGSAGCKVDGVIPGGATRHASEQAAVESLAERIGAGEIDIVLVHDGARPLFDKESLRTLIEEARRAGGAILALPLEDELVYSDGKDITELVPAQGPWRAQTPQAFKADLILAAFETAKASSFEGTDTASTAEHGGIPVAIVMGDPRNIKVTFPADVALAESLLHKS